MGDFDIDINNSSGIEKNELEEFCNLFDLTNLFMQYFVHEKFIKNKTTSKKYRH